jgi:hypothetical protein
MDAIDRHYIEYIDEHQQIHENHWINPGFSNRYVCNSHGEDIVVLTRFNITSVKYIAEIFILFRFVVWIIQSPTTTHIPITEIEKYVDYRIPQNQRRRGHRL